MKKSILVIYLLGALSGCTTLLQPPSFNQLGRFSSYPLNTQTFRISFEARPNIQYSTAQEITLVQAARSTLQHGFKYFEVLNDPSNRSLPPQQTVVYDRGPRPFANPWSDIPQVWMTQSSQVSYTISCFNTSKNSNSFDARLILQNLGEKYGINDNGDIISPPPKH